MKLTIKVGKTTIEYADEREDALMSSYEFGAAKLRAGITVSERTIDMIKELADKAEDIEDKRLESYYSGWS